GGDASQVVQRRVAGDALEETPDLEPPLLEVAVEHRRLVGVRQLDDADPLAAPAEAKLPAAGHADVADPLRLAAWSDQVLVAVVDEEVHRHRAPRAALAPTHREHARAIDAHAERGEQLDQGIEGAIGERRLHVATAHDNAT